MMTNRLVALLFGLACTAAGIAAYPTSASACTDLGPCQPPPVLDPNIEIEPQLDCVDISIQLAGYRNDFRWEFRIQNQCSSTLHSPAHIFACESSLESGEAAPLSIPGNSLADATCPEGMDAGTPDTFSDGGSDADAGTGGGGSVDAGAYPADTWSPDDADAGTDYHRTRAYEITLAGSEFRLIYDYVEPHGEALYHWREEHCRSTVCEYPDTGPGEPDVTPIDPDIGGHDDNPEPDTGDGDDNRKSEPDSGSESDASTMWRASGGGDEHASRACSATGASAPSGAGWLLALCGLIGLVGRRRAPSRG